MAYLSGIGNHAFCGLYNITCLDCQTDCRICFQCLHGLKIIVILIVEINKTVYIIGGGGSNAEDCWPLFFLFGSSWKLWKLMSLVTQQFKKMHNVHAVDVFQFYILDFLFHILLMTFSSRVWFISLYMYLILLNTSLLSTVHC